MQRIAVASPGYSRLLPWLLVLSCLLTGCATPQSHPWGTQVTFRPGAERLTSAALDAAKSPRVWGPVGAAALFQVDHWDRRVSDYARNHTPIFGSQSNAADWSDRLRTLSSVSYYASVLATPGPDQPANWLRAKGAGLLVGLGAIATTDVATLGLKNASSRTRPNGHDDQSFPSAHASRSAVATGLARDNVRDIEMSPGARVAVDVGLDALTIGTSWARVEAGVHFPSDVLIGAALGNFFSRFFDEAFLEPVSDRRTAWTLVPQRGGAEIEWTLEF